MGGRTLRPGTELFPDSDDGSGKRRALLAPDHWEPADRMVRACLNVRVAERGRDLVAPGRESQKRPYLPVFRHLETDFLDRLAAAGFRLETSTGDRTHVTSTMSAGTPICTTGVDYTFPAPGMCSQT